MALSNDQKREEGVLTEGEDDASGADLELSMTAVDLLQRVKDGLTHGPLSPSDRLRAAILGRVIAQGDEETSDSVLRDAMHDDESAVS